MKGKSVLYWITLVMIVSLMALFLFFWWEQYRMRNPEVVVASSFVFQEEIPFECRLVWNEEVLTSPLSGTVSFPGGVQARWVRKGEPLAVIRGASGTRTLRAPDVGYFVAGLDGLEGQWDYMTLWRGESSLPATRGLSLLSGGTQVVRGRPLGKFVPQPQDLRAVGYLDGTDAIIAEIHRGRLDLKENPTDLPFQVGIRVARSLGWRRKVYLTFPLFPPRYLMNRSLSLSLCLAKHSGVILPESALVHREGDPGVFVVKGRLCRFRPVTGRPLGKGRFLVNEGVKAGEIVMVQGKKAREGKVQLW